MTQHIPAGSFDWTDERCDELRRLWATNGPSALGIAEILGCGTRSSVIGKARRLGLGPRRNGWGDKGAGNRRAQRKRGHDGGIASRLVHRPPQTVTRRRIIKNQIMDVQEPEPMPQTIDVDDQAIPRGQRRTLLELTDATCKWPVGTPGAPDFFFCGATAEADRPYCPAHCLRAYSKDYARRPYIPARRDAA